MLSVEYSSSWRDDILQAVGKHTAKKTYFPTETSRRDPADTSGYSFHVVNGTALLSECPWIREFSLSPTLMEMASTVLGVEVKGYEQTDIYSPNQLDTFRSIVNVLEPGQSYEPHDDGTGIAIVLPVTDHPVGGRLVLAGDTKKMVCFSQQIDVD